MGETAGVSPSHDHPHDHHHAAEESATPGPLADASVRTGRPNDAPAIGAVQAMVFRSVYAGVVPKSVLDQFDPDRFAAAWRGSIAQPPTPAHRVMV
ncbi:MAG: hypothetical protein WBG89_09345, partial [Ornithinimicrobium sp.]